MVIFLQGEGITVFGAVEIAQQIVVATMLDAKHHVLGVEFFARVIFQRKYMAGCELTHLAFTRVAHMAGFFRLHHDFAQMAARWGLALCIEATVIAVAFGIDLVADFQESWCVFAQDGFVFVIPVGERGFTGADLLI